ncbi:hypothetical protein ACJX0J_041748, partial [Zea mays]
VEPKVFDDFFACHTDREACQGAIDYKYHVEKLDYHDLPTKHLFFVQALFQVSVLTLNFKGISLLQLKNDDPTHPDKALIVDFLGKFASTNHDILFLNSLHAVAIALSGQLYTKFGCNCIFIIVVIFMDN